MRMTIKADQYEKIINSINVGNSIAESDYLLESARVETPVFFGVLEDKYDIVLGRKGAGKTAIFKLIDFMKKFLLGRRNLVILSGVNASGESIFNKFKNSFKKFSENDFENFWKLYFISLIYNEFIMNPLFDAKLSGCTKEINELRKECQTAGIPSIPANKSKTQLIDWIINNLRSFKIKAPVIVDTKNPTLFSVTPTIEVEFKDKTKTVQEQESIYINNIGATLKSVLLKSGFKVWIILDRLDEVFDRYSSTEFNGLRGLLKAYKSFDIGSEKDIFRIKIFLRDDIKSFLTDNNIYKQFFSKKDVPPLVAATHIFSKESPTLSWSEDEIEQLILNRLLLTKTPLWDYLEIEKDYSNLKEAEIQEKLKDDLRNKNIRIKYWNQIFPEKISSSDSIKWIFTHLKDSNDVVTPRTVIDMLEAANNYQKKKMQTNFSDSQIIFPVEALKDGISVASKAKLEKDIYNEFPKDQKNIKMLIKIGKYKLDKQELKKNFGKQWEQTVENLKRIGILRYIKNSDEYRIEFLFRPAMNIIYKY